MYDLVTFGEAMIRLTSPEFMRLENATSLSITAGGAEMNVAVNAAQLGLQTAWVSRLVDNWVGPLYPQQGARTRRGHVQYRLGGLRRCRL